MKKLAILTQYFPPEMGAPQSRLFETSTALQKLGWNIVVITSMPNYPAGKIFPEFKGKWSCKDKVGDIVTWRYILYPSNSKKSLPRILSMLSFSLTSIFSIFRLHKFKPHYILTESPPLTLAFSGLVLSKFVNARHIMNVSDLWPLSAYELGAISKGRLYNLLEKVEIYLYKHSFACTGQSQQIVDALTSKGSQKALLFRNGVDTKRFIRKQRGKIISGSFEKVKIVYAGLLGIAQGILSICKNVDFHAVNCEFHIYGQGAEKEDIEHYLFENSDSSVYLHDPVPRDQMPEILASYDATIIPLIKPIFGAVPSKIYEAMASGLPIIFAGGGEGSDIIRKYSIGWVCEPSDFSAMQKVLGDLTAMSADEIQRIKNRTIEVASTVFDRSIQIKHLNDFLLNN